MQCVLSNSMRHFHFKEKHKFIFVKVFLKDHLFFIGIIISCDTIRINVGNITGFILKSASNIKYGVKNQKATLTVEVFVCPILTRSSGLSFQCYPKNTFNNNLIEFHNFILL